MRNCTLTPSNVLGASPAWQPPAVELTKVHFIALAPVSWGDGFMRDVSILSLETRCGKIGLGCAYTSAHKLQAAWTQFEPQIQWQALNPNQTKAWVNTAATLPENQGFDGHGADTIPALSAINIALWDLLGQCLAQPISTLIGPAHWQTLPAYASLTLPYDLGGPGETFKQILLDALAQGFKAIKLFLPKFGYRTTHKTATEWATLEENYLVTAREILGKDFTLMLDTFGSAQDWPDNVTWATHISRILASQNYLWFEEPLSPKNTRGYASLRNAHGPKISGGEFLTDPAAFAHWATDKMVDILQPDCTISGGHRCSGN